MKRAAPVIALGLVLAVILAAATGAAFGWRWAFHDLPAPPESAEALWDVRREPSVTVLAADGRVLGVRGPLYGRPARLAELPDYVPQAFLAIEDRRFFEHDGVDRRGLARAMLANLEAGRTVQGGSTLTMQLVKNLILSPERTMRRKIQEIRLALALERLLTKTEILELYLNRIYFGEQAYGIEAAAQRYFSKPAAELSLQEAALLAALPKAPSRLAPTANPEAAQARAEEVLQAMMQAGFIDSMTYLTAVSTPPTLAEPSADALQLSIFGHAFDQAVAEARAVLDDPELAPDLVITTTLDPDLQRAAHAALTAVLDDQGDARTVGEAALAAIDLTGAVRALVGGRDYRQSQFNRAVQARRQPGSAFKPIVFAAAFEAGMDPATAFEDQPIEIEGWSPENYGGGYRGRITIADALKRSINTVAAQAGAETGPQAVIEMADRLGIEGPLPAVPAITLGAAEVRLLDLTAAYAVFANDGRRRDPHLVAEVRNTRGDLLWAAPGGAGRPVIEAEHARWMSTMLQSVILDGTGTRARLRGHQAAGKTGTSQNSRDAWFVGYTGHLAAGVWVGNDNDAPTDRVTGGQLPAEIWQRFMTEAHADRAPIALSAPAPQRRGEREERLAAYYSSLTSRFEAVLDGGA